MSEVKNIGNIIILENNNGLVSVNINATQGDKEELIAKSHGVGLHHVKLTSFMKPNAFGQTFIVSKGKLVYDLIKLVGKDIGERQQPTVESAKSSSVSDYLLRICTLDKEQSAGVVEAFFIETESNENDELIYHVSALVSLSPKIKDTTSIYFGLRSISDYEPHKLQNIHNVDTVCYFDIIQENPNP
ncbi:hypothetical protein [Proteus mirabilis]|uniref:hypothetical protein n=1 Tax=Proteus mirabilis TaxID=584 RepID=UPI0034D39A9D